MLIPVALFAALAVLFIGRSFLLGRPGRARPIFSQAGMTSTQLSEGLVHALISDRGFLRTDTRIERFEGAALILQREGACGRLVLLPSRDFSIDEQNAMSSLRALDARYGLDRSATLVVVGGDEDFGKHLAKSVRRTRLVHVRDDGSVLESRRGWGSSAPRLVVESALDRMGDDLRDGAFPFIEWETARTLVSGEDPRAFRPQPPPRGVATSALTVAIILCFAAEVAFSRDSFSGDGAGLAVVYRMGGIHQPAVLAGEWQRLIASPFLHFGLLHLVMNGWAQSTLGAPIEFLVGSWRFLALWVGSGLGASFTSLAFNSTSVSAGASGAIFGLLGAFTTFVFFRKDVLPQPVPRALRNGVLLTLLLNLGISFIPSIDMAAHAGGFVTGAVLAFGLVRGEKRSALTRTNRNLLRLSVAAIVLVGVGFTSWQHRAFAATAAPDRFVDRTVGDAVVPVPPDFSISESRAGATTIVEAEGHPASPYSIRYRVSEPQTDDEAAKALLSTWKSDQGQAESSDWIAISRVGTQRGRAIEVVVVAPSSCRDQAEALNALLGGKIR